VKVVKGKQSTLPPVGDLAAMIRGGLDVQGIADLYGVARATVVGKFMFTRYDHTTGNLTLAATEDKPTIAATDSGSMNYVSAAQNGEYTGLPTTPIPYRGHRPPTGLDWGTIADQYVAAGGSEQPEVWPVAAGKVSVYGVKGRAPIRTYEDAVNEEQAS